MTSENLPTDENHTRSTRQPVKRTRDHQSATADQFVEDLPPIEERCGLEHVDINAEGLLVHAPLDRVCELLAPLGTRWEQDVYSQTIQGRGLIVFQLRGHAWTGILNGGVTYKYRDMLGDFTSDHWNWKLQAKSLSQQLDTRTIYYEVSDTSGVLGYTYWENGRLMERLAFDESIWQETHEDYDEEEEFLHDGPARTFEPHLFESQLRPLTAAEIENAYDFITDFLCEQKAYAVTMLFPTDFQQDDFVRIDYFAFPPPATSDEFPADLPAIEERYGTEPLIGDAEGLLVHAPLDQVCELLAQSGTRWEQDVYSQTIQGRGLIVYQFQGHAWTGILDGHGTHKYGDMLAGYVSDNWNWQAQAQSLSQQLNTRTIYYKVSGISLTYCYTYWENGRLMERLVFDQSGLDEDYYNEEEAWDDRLVAPNRPHLFESQLRPLTAAEIENTYDFVDNFLHEQKAYGATMLDPANFRQDDFVRIDYIAFA